MEQKFLTATICMLSTVAFGQSVSKDKMATNRPQRRWVTSIQTGFASNFQLTLGGTFGAGPAWQSKVTTGVANAFVPGDSLYLYGSDTFDTPSHNVDMQAGVGYKAPVWRRGTQSLVLGSGLQHWRFPSVLTGTVDWLIPGNLVYQAKVGKVPVMVTSDSWTLLTSDLPKGSLLYTQAWMDHPLVKRDAVKVTFRHGPAQTQSWNFYGTNGNRVIRYQTMVVVSFKDMVIDGGWRKQWGQQKRIPNNGFWQFSFTKTFTK